MEIKDPIPETVTVQDLDFKLCDGSEAGWTLYPTDNAEQRMGWVLVTLNPNPLVFRELQEIHEVNLAHVMTRSARHRIFTLPAKKPNVSQIRPTPPTSGHRPGSDEEPRKDIRIEEA